jgi:hypothetical protein
MDSGNSHGSGLLNFRIGDISFALTSDDPSLELEAQGPVRHFLVAGGEPDVRLRAAWGDSCGPEAGEKLFEAGTLWQLHRQGERFQFRFTAPVFGPEPYKTASFNADFTAGEVRLRADCFQSKGPVYPLEYPLDELLMVHLLAQGRGVEVHGCGLLDTDGRGYLFLGKSGAGKSTLARLWTGVPGVREGAPVPAQIPHVLSDDRIILRFLDGRLWMYGTPWHGEAELASAQRTAVSRIFFLGRGKKNETLPLAGADAVARLVSCSFLPFHSRTGLDFTLAFLQQVTQAVPCTEFRFFPDGRAVDFVRSAVVAYA